MKAQDLLYFMYFRKLSVTTNQIRFNKVYDKNTHTSHGAPYNRITASLLSTRKQDMRPERSLLFGRPILEG